jgi:enoyl-CoA hydratase/carnithine racemase
VSDATRYAVDGGIATITLNRPDNRNALSNELMNSLGDNLEQAMTDDAVRLVVLTNEGNTFCAGADLKGGSAEPSRHSLVDILVAMQDAPKPVVGKLAGHCTGGGNGLAAACDISIAADDVFFAFTEVRIGVAPAIISVACLPKLRRADALELFLTGKRCPAPRAAEIGLINRTVPRDELDTAVAELTSDLVAGGPNALAAAKGLVYNVPAMTREEAFKWTANLSAELFRSEEAADGIAAFRKRSPPRWVPTD